MSVNLFVTVHTFDGKPDTEQDEGEFSDVYAAVAYARHRSMRVFIIGFRIVDENGEVLAQSSAER